MQEGKPPAHPLNIIPKAKLRDEGPLTQRPKQKCYGNSTKYFSQEINENI